MKNLNLKRLKEIEHGSQKHRNIQWWFDISSTKLCQEEGSSKIPPPRTTPYTIPQTLPIQLTLVGGGHCVLRLLAKAKYL